MKNDKEKWVNDVLNSMEGSRRAKPSPELFDQILQEIDRPETQVLTMPHWSRIAAVAALLIMGNVFAVQQISQSRYSDLSEVSSSDSDNYMLVSDYKIYE
ncbi:hypothetical protein [Portibacter lacus]|uniref:Uncharacterized protein n=1 Tax=Portibacter lacus TaxID=1099794 RepID=A0AA37SR25_9BACT|nr:hypothetical protein [Portibacter lacus]GLR18277.1 hypothetical protein GCM10007940_28930 [Portibacter lacus]